jgi:crotonobetaine/carnitine-CoA ligase
MTDDKIVAQYDDSLQMMPFESRTVTGVLARTVARLPEKVFVTFEGESLTYRHFDKLSNQFAHFANSLGIADGKLSIMLPNGLEFLYGWFGCAKINAVYVPINNEYRGDILRHQLAKADVTHLMLHADYVPRLLDVIDALPQLFTLIVVGAGAEVIAEVRKSLPQRLRVVEVEQFQAYPDSAPMVEARHEDHHCISFTSGTTGPSKGVLSTHCHVVSFSLDWIKLNHFGEQDVTYCPMPLFHALGSWLGVLAVVICGARIALTRRFSATGYWDDVRLHGASVVLGIFSIVPLLLKQSVRLDDANNPARVYYIGQQNADFERRFNLKIVNAFGATETGAVTYTPYEQVAPHGSCGRPHSEKYDVRIVDEFDREVALGEVGEIVVRSLHPFTMMEGYYNDPDATAEAFRNQWFHTGDNARRDDAGWYFFVDRKKDAIRVRGENISSFEIESVVSRHPSVLEVAAIAIASPLGEDDVKLFVVKRPGTDLSHDALHAFCILHMPSFWLPRAIEFIKAMPHTPTQKVMKYRLRQNEEGGELQIFESALRRRA